MLDCYEFSTAIQNLGLELNQADVQSLFRSFDRNGDQQISQSEFISVVMGPLNEFRADIAMRIFKFLDVQGDGFITL